jgi:hypothetical protein
MLQRSEMSTIFLTEKNEVKPMRFETFIKYRNDKSTHTLPFHSMKVEETTSNFNAANDNSNNHEMEQHVLTENVSSDSNINNDDSNNNNVIESYHQQQQVDYMFRCAFCGTAEGDSSNLSSNISLQTNATVRCGHQLYVGWDL